MEVGVSELFKGANNTLNTKSKRKLIIRIEP